MNFTQPTTNVAFELPPNQIPIFNSRYNYYQPPYPPQQNSFTFHPDNLQSSIPFPNTPTFSSASNQIAVPVNTPLNIQSTLQNSNESQEAMQENTHDWQVIKKRKTRSYENIQVNPNQSYPNTYNRYTVLTDNDDNNDVNMQTNESTTATKPQTNEIKPPPIFIHGVTNFKGMVDNLAKITDDETYHSKALADNTVKINALNIDTYRKLIKHLRDEKIVHHTYQLKQERSYRIVIRNLHHSIPTDDIQAELEEAGHKARNILNIRHRVNKEPLSMFFVDLEPKENNHKIFELKAICGTIITIEPPRKKSGIVQCTRCQHYGHTKTYCTRPYNCVKCGGPHNTTTCSKTRDTPANCVLCGGRDHPANYKGCKVYQNLLYQRNKSNPTFQYNSNAARSRPNTFPETRDIHNTNSPEIINNKYTNTHNMTYAKASTGTTGAETRNDPFSTITQQLTSFLSEFKNMFAQMMQQNLTMLNLLTSLVNKH